MATFKLGAIVTSIVGSIGGTTFKRQGSSLVMQAKSHGASRAKLLANPRLGRNSTIFKKWLYLTDAEREAWRVIAQNITVKNKFGEDVFISPVNFFRKCNLAIGFTNTDINVFTWNSNVNVATFYPNMEVDYDNKILELRFDIPNENAHIALMVEYSLQPLRNVSFVSRAVWAYGIWQDAISQNVGTDFFEKFPFINENYNIRLYALCYNTSGVVSIQVASNVLVKV